MQTTPVEIDEVDDGAVSEPVDQIADCPAQNAGHGEGEQFLLMVAVEQNKNRYDCYYADYDECRLLPAGGIGQKAEGGPWIVDVNDIQKIVYLFTPAQTESLADPDFTGLIGHDDQNCC